MRTNAAIIFLDFLCNCGFYHYLFEFNCVFTFENRFFFTSSAASSPLHCQINNKSIYYSQAIFCFWCECSVLFIGWPLTLCFTIFRWHILTFVMCHGCKKMFRYQDECVWCYAYQNRAQFNQWSKMDKCGFVQLRQKHNTHTYSTVLFGECDEHERFNKTSAKFLFCVKIFGKRACSTPKTNETAIETVRNKQTTIIYDYFNIHLWWDIHKRHRALHNQAKAPKYGKQK